MSRGRRPPSLKPADVRRLLEDCLLAVLHEYATRLDEATAEPALDRITHHQACRAALAHAGALLTVANQFALFHADASDRASASMLAVLVDEARAAVDAMSTTGNPA